MNSSCPAITFIEQHGLTAPDGVTQVRIQKDLGESAYGYAYLLKLTSPNPDAYVDPETGKLWEKKEEGKEYNETYSLSDVDYDNE